MLRPHTVLARSAVWPLRAGPRCFFGPSFLDAVCAGYRLRRKAAYSTYSRMRRARGMNTGLTSCLLLRSPDRRAYIPGTRCRVAVRMVCHAT